MNASSPHDVARPLGLWALAGALGLLVGCGSSPGAPQANKEPEKPKGTGTNVVATNAASATNLHVGVFVDDPGAGGLDPFFPRSTRWVKAAPIAVTPGPAIPAIRPALTNLVLRAIVVTDDDRMARINQTTLSVGDEATIRFPGGKAKVKLVEIEEKSVQILVDGEPQKLSLPERAE